MAARDYAKMTHALSFAWQLGFLIALPIGGSIFLGVLADRYLGTGIVFTLVGTILGVCITVRESYRLLAPLLKHAPPEK